MTQSKRFRFVSWLSAAAALAAVLSVGAPRALAAPDCRTPDYSGYLCFYDNATSNYGKVLNDNPVWRNLPGNWDNRSDNHYNRGQSHGVCLFGETQYRDALIWLPRGSEVIGVWTNTISSNDWMLTGDRCW